MDFVSVRIITDDIKRLVRFYEDIGLNAIWYTEEFAELSTSTGTLAIGSKRTMDLFGSGLRYRQAIARSFSNSMCPTWTRCTAGSAGGSKTSYRRLPPCHGAIARCSFGIRTAIWSTSLRRSPRRQFAST